MSGKRYTEEFKIAAVKQVAERGHPASEVAARLGWAFTASTPGQSATVCLKMSARPWIPRPMQCAA